MQAPQVQLYNVLFFSDILFSISLYKEVTMELLLSFYCLDICYAQQYIFHQ